MGCFRRTIELQYCATIATQTLGRQGHVGIHLLRVCEVWGVMKVAMRDAVYHFLAITINN